MANPEDTSSVFIPSCWLWHVVKKMDELSPQVGERKDYYWSWRERRHQIPKFLGVPPESLSDPILTDSTGSHQRFGNAQDRRERHGLNGMPASPGSGTGPHEYSGRRRYSSKTNRRKTGLRRDDAELDPSVYEDCWLLTDQGGTLSHAAIVGREYGSPAWWQWVTQQPETKQEIPWRSMVLPVR
ncbi:MAG: hypothetical protein CM1200mP18_14920 [Gammaproteobacteria bacterium]|nr:MAG: hypothetical protein CM1200mP18_14920 [Gammaproteobacteria bacterium]